MLLAAVESCYLSEGAIRGCMLFALAMGCCKCNVRQVCASVGGTGSEQALAPTQLHSGWLKIR